MTKQPASPSGRNLTESRRISLRGCSCISRSEGGVSLVEAITVVALLLVIAAFAMPDMSDFSTRRKVSSLFRDLNILLTDARLAAYKANANVVVQFDSATEGTIDRITAFVDNGEGGGIAKDEIRQHGEAVLATLSAGRRGDDSDSPGWPVSFTTNLNNNRLILRPHPGIFGGTITVYWRGEEQGRLIVNSLGRVRVER